MPLTPQDVSNKRFTTVRLREGYDMTEVDQFLDEVEAELTRITAENDSLRAQLQAAGLVPEPPPVVVSPAAPSAPPTVRAAVPSPETPVGEDTGHERAEDAEGETGAEATHEEQPSEAGATPFQAEQPSAEQDGEPAAVEQSGLDQPRAEETGVEESGVEPSEAEQTSIEQTSAEQTSAEQVPAPVPTWAPEPTSTAPSRPMSAAQERELIHVTTTAEASAAATRLLELAGRNADELVLEAKDEADRILTEARTEVERLEEESRSRVASREEESRQRAEALEREVEERRRNELDRLEREKAALDTEIQNLRTFEREYRAELRSYFEEQLAALDGQGSGGVLVTAPSGEENGSHGEDRGMWSPDQG